MAGRDNGNEVGYGKPPKQIRFAKGHSGNPKGRPKGAKNLSTILQKIGRELLTVTINGRTVRMTKLEASTHQLANKAASGDLKAIRELLDWFRDMQELDQDSRSLSTLDDRDKPVMANILRRLRQAGLEERSDRDAKDPSAGEEEQ